MVDEKIIIIITIITIIQIILTIIIIKYVIAASLAFATTN